jgi:hypothetical protein
MAYMPKGRGFGLMNINKNKLVFTRECGSSLRLPYPNDKLRSIIKKYNLHPITIHGLRIHMLPYYSELEPISKKFRNDWGTLIFK